MAFYIDSYLFPKLTLLVSGMWGYVNANKIPLSYTFLVFLSLFYLEILNTSFQKKIIKTTVPFCLIILGSQYYLNNDL